MDRSARHWIRRKTSNGDIFYDADNRKVYRDGADIIPVTSQDFYSLPTFDSRAPLKVYFDFTYLCNLECRHCITNSFMNVWTSDNANTWRQLAFTHDSWQLCAHIVGLLQLEENR